MGGHGGASAGSRFGAGFRLLLAAASLSGVLLNFLAPGGSPSGRWNLFAYFTIQSNLLVSLALILVGLGDLRGKPPLPKLELFRDATRLWIWMTGLAFHFLLSALWHPQGLAGIANILLHYVTPLGVLAEWLLLPRRGVYRLSAAWLWVAYPLAYVAFSLARGALSGFYPYWFLNPTKSMPDGVGSLGGVLVWAGLLAFGFFLLGLAATGVDALRLRLRRRLSRRGEASS